MKNIFNIIILLYSVITVNAGELLSPDGNVLLKVETNELGNIIYTLSYKNKLIIKYSKLGFECVDNLSLYDDFAIESESIKTVDESWKPVWGEVAEIRNNYNELLVGFKQKSGKKMNVRFRLFNDGLGFRYEFPDQNKLRHFVIRETKVNNKTVFR